jgi:hypothetical protein
MVVVWLKLPVRLPMRDLAGALRASFRPQVVAQINHALILLIGNRVG